MKKLVLLLTTWFICTVIVTAQTYNPSCYSNAKGWKITKVETASAGTFVHLSVYTYEKGYEFFIHPGMYIENYNVPGTARYNIVGFDGNKLNTIYQLEPYTEYNFTLQFEKIPGTWKDINIIEPSTTGYQSFYWKYISLDRPSSERLPLDNFFLHKGLSFLKNYAHPANDFKRYTYSIDYNAINVTLYYENCITDLSIQFDNNEVTSVKLVKDTDWLMPFVSLEVLAAAGDAMFGNSTSRARLEQLSGRDLARMALAGLWNRYK